MKRNVKRALRIALALALTAQMMLPLTATASASSKATETPIVSIPQSTAGETAEADHLTLQLDGRNFTVSAEEDAGKGIIVVALYESKSRPRLLDIKMFEAKAAVNGTFSHDGYVKAFWLLMPGMIPCCRAAEGEINTAAPTSNVETELILTAAKH